MSHLNNRLAALECRNLRKPSDGKAREALLDNLNGISFRLGGGELSDNDNASTAERVALAFERGDFPFAQKLLLAAVGREEKA